MCSVQIAATGATSGATAGAATAAAAPQTQHGCVVPQLSRRCTFTPGCPEAATCHISLRTDMQLPATATAADAVTDHWVPRWIGCTFQYCCQGSGTELLVNLENRCHAWQIISRRRVCVLSIEPSAHKMHCSGCSHTGCADSAPSRTCDCGPQCIIGAHVCTAPTACAYFFYRS